jgi:peptidoglycan/LPS O-acetylase OafA/YrhL
MKKYLYQLESLRGFAAIYVFLHHAHVSPNSGLGALFYLGQEVVVLFFLLSGFVIHFSMHTEPSRRISVPVYVLHRARRIYPILLFALIASYISACIRVGSLVDIDLHNLTMNILMFQDLSALKRGVWADTYYNNSPLWSLSYEWWFYMLFIPLGLTRTFGVSWQRAIVGIVSISGFFTYQLAPNPVSLFASYFAIWWAGVELSKEYIEYMTVSVRNQWPTLLLIGICAFLWFMPVAMEILQGHRQLKLGVDPVLQFRHFLSAFVILLVGFAWRAKKLVFFNATFGMFKIFAPISYSLYLLHVPMLNALDQFGLEEYPIIRVFLALLLLVPICNLLEVRLQKIINRITNHLFSSPNPYVAKEGIPDSALN